MTTDVSVRAHVCSSCCFFDCFELSYHRTWWFVFPDVSLTRRDATRRPLSYCSWCNRTKGEVTRIITQNHVGRQLLTGIWSDICSLSADSEEELNREKSVISAHSRSKSTVLIRDFDLPTSLQPMGSRNYKWLVHLFLASILKKAILRLPIYFSCPRKSIKHRFYSYRKELPLKGPNAFLFESNLIYKWRGGEGGGG